MSRDTFGRILLTVSLVSLSWAVLLLLTGGFRVATPLVRISSSDPARPLILGLVCAAALWYFAPHIGIAFVEHVEPIVKRKSLFVAVAAAGAVVFTGLKWGTFSAGGSDAYGYVSQADLWHAGGATNPPG